MPAALGLFILAAPLHAEDPRIVERLFDPSEVVRIEGKASVQATIRFAEDELIENVAIGDSESWQVTPNKRANLLFLKPLAERASTNMTVVTNRQTYLFDLVASPANRNPLYILSFTYPEALRQHRKDEPNDAHPPERPNNVELAAASDPYAVVNPADLNFAWDAEGDTKLVPAEIYDDGEATFLTWRVGSAMPAILVKDHEGTEGPVNFAVRGDVIVVDGVPREIVLRAGNDSATLINRGPVREARQAALAQPARDNTEIKR
jgi:type IV secretion system protein VirB9